MYGALGPWPTRAIVGLFWVAAAGLGWRYLPIPNTLTQPAGSVAIALALLLVCIDQGRMAWVDLFNVYQVSLTDRRVVVFYAITLITIVIELIGFYLAWKYLALGMAVFLVSQLFFNTAANLQLYPGSHDPIRPFPLQTRWPVLLANGVALSLIALWQANQFRQLTSSLWLGMVVIYLAVKYLAAGKDVAADKRS